MFRITTNLKNYFMDSSIQKISDALYLCSPFLCFDIAKTDEGFEVTHYAPFAQKTVLQKLLGKEFKLTHKKRYDNFTGVTSSDAGFPDGTVKGLLFAFKEFIKANMADNFTEFTLFLSPSGVVTSDLFKVQNLFDISLLPCSLKAIYSLLSFNLPVHQAYQRLSEDYTAFVEPDYYRFALDTALGVFERHELLGSYGVVSTSIQGYFLSYENAN